MQSMRMPERGPVHFINRLQTNYGRFTGFRPHRVRSHSEPLLIGSQIQFVRPRNRAARQCNDQARRGKATRQRGSTYRIRLV